MSRALENTSISIPAGFRSPWPQSLHLVLQPGLAIVAASFFAALFVPKGIALAAYSDILQVALQATVAGLAFRSFLRTRARSRAFWLLICIGMVFWTASTVIWTLYEVWWKRPVPDVPAGDVLLIAKIIPLTAAVGIGPEREGDGHLRAFGLLDFSMLVTYALYLYAFAVYAFRLVPGGADIYNFRFDLANAAGNQVFLLVAASAVLKAQGNWKCRYWIYFVAAACYALSSILADVAIDLGRYYAGSIYDLPLVISVLVFMCVPVMGASEEHGARPAQENAEEPLSRVAMVTSHLAMLAALSTPAIGIMLVSGSSMAPQLRSFRLAITLLTLFLLTLQICIKQDLLTIGLIGSLRRLSDTYATIQRFKSHLTQSEKLTSLGALVANVATQIKDCMTTILELSARFSLRSGAEPRVCNMAGKIAQYAQRTDRLVDNMLHFAQESPLRLEPVDVKPLLESALHLSRAAKVPNVHVELVQAGHCPAVRADSSQLLHVFLQLVSNALDALEESGGGSFTIVMRSSGTRLLLEFADSGPGMKEPQRVFEPFYTTKEVGKGTGLGLSTCYGIIQQHDGEISCRNRPEGGAAVSIVLPLAVVPRVQQAPEREVLAEGVL